MNEIKKREKRFKYWIYTGLVTAGVMAALGRWLEYEIFGILGLAAFGLVAGFFGLAILYAIRNSWKAREYIMAVIVSFAFLAFLSVIIYFIFLAP